MRPAVAEVTLQVPAWRCRAPGPSRSSGVHAREEQPPPAVKPLEWFVLTTLRVTSADDATRILGWYALRWRIEEYFRVLKSGCCERSGRHGHQDAVVGWRIRPARARDA